MLLPLLQNNLLTTAGGVNVNATTVVLTLTTHQATVSLPIEVNANAVSLVLTTYPATVDAPSVVQEQNSGGWFAYPYERKYKRVEKDEEEELIQKQREAEEEILLLEEQRKERLKNAVSKSKVRELEIRIHQAKYQLDELKVLNALIHEQREQELLLEEEEVMFLMMKLVA